MESQVLDPVDKPHLNEDAFQQLLAAALVIQQQNDFEKLEQRLAAAAPKPRANPEKTLAVIAETQHMLRTQPSDRAAAAALIAERLQKLIDASGVAVALARDGKMEYCAALGSASALAGLSVPMPEEPSAGHATSDADGSLNATLSAEQPTGEHNSVTLPLRFDGKIAGLLEVRFHSAAVDQQDLHICHLMAGLMIEALARSADLEWKQALAVERANMAEAIERIQPQLERLGSEGSPATLSAEALATPSHAVSADAIRIIEEVVPTPSVQPASSCMCGYRFGAAERFCGRCGKQRPSIVVTPRPAGNNGQGNAAISGTYPSAESQLRPWSQDAPAVADDRYALLPGEIDPNPLAAQRNPMAVQALRYEAETPWSSSRKTRLWLESLQKQSPLMRWVNRHRANVYIAVAVTLLLIAILGIRSPEPAPTRNSPQPTMSLLDEIMVGLGLAEPPQAPVSNGNPSARVWVDLHTALYYCPGSELYGKTPGGKYTTQRDAQLDQFQPAGQHTCN